MQTTVPRTVKILTSIWVCAVIAGIALLIDYSAAPGTDAAPPPTWPAETAVTRHVSNSTLMMFVHPKCPCSNASLSELARVAARCHARMDLKVVFVKPQGAPSEWNQSPLKSKAEQIPRVQTIVDQDGRIAATFGVKTSGHCVVYDTDGKLLFSGGITAGRGHEGDSPGQSIIQAIAQGHTVDQAQQCATFGCALFSAQ